MNKKVTNGKRTKFQVLSTYNIAVIAMLTAMSLVLSEFPKIPNIYGFLDLDFSDVPIIFSGFFVAPWAPIIISAIKNGVGLFSSHTGMIGELSNFLLSSAYAFVASFFGRKGGHIRVIIFTGVAVVAATALALASNHFVMFPLYFGGQNIPLLFAVILPFNLLKFGTQSAVFLLLYFSLKKPIVRLRNKDACKDSPDPFCMANMEEDSPGWVDETIRSAFEFQLPEDKDDTHGEGGNNDSSHHGEGAA